MPYSKFEFHNYNYKNKQIFFFGIPPSCRLLNIDAVQKSSNVCDKYMYVEEIIVHMQHKPIHRYNIHFCILMIYKASEPCSYYYLLSTVEYSTHDLRWIAGIQYIEYCRLSTDQTSLTDYRKILAWLINRYDIPFHWHVPFAINELLKC